MKKLIIIAAIGKNGELGKNNDLIWHLKKDLKYFKEVTLNHHVLMGKNTFLSLPKMLDNRVHLVLNDDDYKFPEGVIVLKSIDEFFSKAKEIDDDIYVIGGAFIYKQFINYANEMLLTLIDEKDNNADVYFPIINDNIWKKQIIKTDEENNIKFDFVKFERK